MSWTSVFPVLTDEMVEAYQRDATTAERQEHDLWFRVDRVENPRMVPHIFTTSLFWKNARSNQPELVIKNRAAFMKGEKRRKLPRFHPWDHYVEPLLRAAHEMHRKRRDVAMRVYLAQDMAFLTADLVEAGCEVRLMATSSLRHNPGAMWRFLALEEEGRLVTNIDAGRSAGWASDVVRTEETARMKLGWWRVPVWGDVNEMGNLRYKPILGCQFGTNKGLPAELLMKALIWHTLRGSIETKATPPGGTPVTIHGSQWPDYGFDEWFLQTAVYPRAAIDGLLTFVPAEAKSRLLPLDIEYTKSANRRSELVYFGTAGNSSAPPPIPKPRKAPVKEPRAVLKAQTRHDIIAYTYEANCGLGEAAARNIEAMRDLGLTVEHRIWKTKMPREAALSDPKQVYYHHWHPQPCDRGRKWRPKEFGKAQHLAFWAYETDTMPTEFSGVAAFMCEVWVPSRFCRKIFRATGKPVHVVPHDVASTGRGLDPLPGQKDSAPLTVLFLFDAWSRFARKNPDAVIRVFKESFAGRWDSRLIIKAHHLSPEELVKLHAMCGAEHWISIINEFMPEEELNRLFDKADLLLSLQRCEGFGLNLAKALARGVPVITTGYGGQTDFCRKDIAFLVPYKMEQASEFNDPWYAIGRWGAPDERAAVRMVREVADLIRQNKPEVNRRRKRGQELIASEFSGSCLRKRIARRLKHFFPGRNI